jgi:hypothetical protein
MSPAFFITLQRDLDHAVTTAVLDHITATVTFDITVTFVVSLVALLIS